MHSGQYVLLITPSPEKTSSNIVEIHLLQTINYKRGFCREGVKYIVTLMVDLEVRP